MSTSLEVSVLRNHAALERLRPSWERLLEVAANPGIYQTPTWVESWYRSYASPGEIYVVAVEDRGELAGLAAFSRSALVRRGGAPQLLVSAGAEHLADGDALVRGGEPRIAEAISDHLARLVRTGLTVVNVKNLRHDSSFHTSLCARPDVVLHSTETVYAPVVDFELVEDPAATLAKGRRLHRLPRRLRRLTEAMGEVEFSFDDDTEDSLSHMKSMLAARWDLGEGPPLFRDPAREDFTRSVYRSLVDDGHARIGVVRAGGQRVAIQLLTIVGSRVVCENIAYDPELRKFAPGHLVLSEVLDWASECGVTQVDLRTPQSDYKESWSTALVGYSDLTMVRPGRLGQVAMKARKPVVRARKRRLCPVVEADEVHRPAP